MNIFELAWVASPVIGAVFGVRNHTTIGVPAVWGGILGAAAGVAAYFAIIFAVAIVMGICTGQSPFGRGKEPPESGPDPIPDKGKTPGDF